MTKARSNMYVYSSTCICGFIYENEKTGQPEPTRAIRKTYLTHPYIIPNFHAERELKHPKTTFFSSFLLQQYTNVRTSSSCCLSLIKESSYTHSAEVPVWHTPVEVAEVRFSMTCRFFDGERKRGNVHIPAMISVAFPDVVLLDRFI